MSGEGYPSLCLVGEVAGVVWHLQGAGLPKSPYGVQYTCYCPVLCGLVSNATSDFKGFLFVQGAGDPLLPLSPVSLMVVLVSLDGDGESVGAVPEAGELCHLTLGLLGTKVARKRWGPVCLSPPCRPQDQTDCCHWPLC